MLLPSISVLAVGAAMFAALLAIDWYVSRPEIVRMLALTRTKRSADSPREDNRACFRSAA